MSISFHLSEHLGEIISGRWRRYRGSRGCRSVYKTEDNIQFPLKTVVVRPGNGCRRVTLLLWRLRLGGGGVRFLEDRFIDRILRLCCSVWFLLVI